MKTARAAKLLQGFPAGPVVKTLPADAGGRGVHPWSGKIPHSSEQLSPCGRNYRALTLEPCSAAREITAVRSLRATIAE